MMYKYTHSSIGVFRGLDIYTVSHTQSICKHLAPNGDHCVVLRVLRLSLFAKFDVVQAIRLRPILWNGCKHMANTWQTHGKHMTHATTANQGNSFKTRQGKLKEDMSKRQRVAKHGSSRKQSQQAGAQQEAEGCGGSECPICFEELSRTGSRHGLKSSHFPCGHLCCQRCFDRVDVCPLCRTSKDGISGQEQRERREHVHEEDIPEFVRRFLGIVSRDASGGQRRQRRPAQIVRYQAGDGGNPANFTMTMFNISNTQQIIEAAFSAAGSNPPPGYTSFLARLPTMNGVPEIDRPEHVSVDD